MGRRRPDSVERAVEWPFWLHAVDLLSLTSSWSKFKIVQLFRSRCQPRLQEFYRKFRRRESFQEKAQKGYINRRPCLRRAKDLRPPRREVLLQRDAIHGGEHYGPLPDQCWALEFPSPQNLLPRYDCFHLGRKSGRVVCSQHGVYALPHEFGHHGGGVGDSWQAGCPRPRGKSASQARFWPAFPWASWPNAQVLRLAWLFQKRPHSKTELSNMQVYYERPSFLELPTVDDSCLRRHPFC